VKRWSRGERKIKHPKKKRHPKCLLEKQRRMAWGSGKDIAGRDGMTDVKGPN